jgi:DNA-binding response OmpR family regulator
MTTKAKKICVVDDDLSIGEIISQILELEGFDVHSYKAGREGIEKSKQSKPDLLLLDYFLPGENAEDIVRNFRKNFGDGFPIILMSASRQAEEQAKLLEVDEFIAKPFHREGLLNAIERHLQ